ncbi:hypothetical protein [Spirosoma aerolatum]|uniref:hypothetical protein n=1 Tax=Spirosoma aerolatum TaxID=1211326 RepID=UPI0009AE953C|nr:hypothetical protein [Spirosoma aerolatum]
MSTKVKKSQKRRMNALLQIAMMQAVHVHSYKRPEWAKCYNVNPLTDTASFYFSSSHGAQVGNGECTLPIWIHEDNNEIIRRLVECIRNVTGEAEHNYRRQVRQAAQVALAAFPDQRQSIAQTVSFLVH